MLFNTARPGKITQGVSDTEKKDDLRPEARTLTFRGRVAEGDLAFPKLRRRGKRTEVCQVSVMI